MSSPDPLHEELAALRPQVPRNFALRVEAAIAREAAVRRRTRRSIGATSVALALAAVFAMVLRAVPSARAPQDSSAVVASPWTLEGRRTVRVHRITVTGLDPHTLAVLTVTEPATATATATGTATGTGTATATETPTASQETPMFAAKAAIVLAATAGAVLTVHVVRGRAAVHTEEQHPGLILAAGDRASVPASGGSTPTVHRAESPTAVARTAPPARAHAAASDPTPDQVANGEECEPQDPDEGCDCADGKCEKGHDDQQATHVELQIAGAPMTGPRDARVTIVEMVDFQCPFCERAVATVQDLAALYPDDVRVVIKHMPLPGHKLARPAAIAAMAAHRQGKFWEMHEMLFANQSRLDAASILGYARHLGLDVARFEADLADPAIAAQIDADFAEATAKGFRGVPAFTINGRVVLGALPLEELRAVVDEELARVK